MRSGRERESESGEKRGPPVDNSLFPGPFIPQRNTTIRLEVRSLHESLKYSNCAAKDSIARICSSSSRIVSRTAKFSNRKMESVD